MPAKQSTDVQNIEVVDEVCLNERLCGRRQLGLP